jgi:hypothetical protein
MDYEIKSTIDEDQLHLKSLVTRIESLTTAKITFIDVVSVEITKNQPYDIKWFAENEDNLLKYYKLVGDYFTDKNAISLLFLKYDNEAIVNNARTLFFTGGKSSDCNGYVNISKHLYDQFVLSDKRDDIERDNEKTHIEKWETEILNKIGFSNASFTKIEFSINKRKYVAALWLVFNGNVFYWEKFKANYKLIIENFLWMYSYNDTAKKLIHETHIYAIKSAIAAIMARNLSHNLGSHVITNTKAELEQLAVNNSDLQPQLSGLAKLLHYIQERQDFIAVLAAGETYASGPVNLKEHIFDYIAYDGPSIRHKSSEFRNYILEHLVKSESFTRDESQQLELQLIVNTKDKSHCLKSLKEDDVAVKALNKISLSIPYGLNGRQAFLTIIENFIRNSAKHLKNDLKKNLTIGIAIEKVKIDVRRIKGRCNNNQYQITIFDNKANFDSVIHNINKQGKVFEKKKDRGEYEIISGSLQILSGQKTNHNNKGLKEMLICLAWMQGEDNYSIIEDNPSKLDFQVVPVDDCGKYSKHKDANFGIRFNLDCYHEDVYVVKKDLNKALPEHVTKLEFDPKKNNNIKEFQKFIFNLPSSQTYVIVDDNVERVNTFRRYLPRVIEYNGTNEDVYNCYYNNFIGDERINLVIIDQSGEKKDAKKVEKDERIRFISNQDEEEQINKLDQNGESKYILFRNHYEKLESKNDGKPIKDFIKELKGNCIFIEGISGGNYTNSLIRTAEFSKKHVNKILESCLTRICLIDERLYDKFKDPKNDGAIDNTHSLTLEGFKAYLEQNDKEEFDFDYFMNLLQDFAKTKNVKFSRVFKGAPDPLLETYIEKGEFNNTQLCYFRNEDIYDEDIFQAFLRTQFIIVTENGKSLGSYYKNKNIDIFNINPNPNQDSLLHVDGTIIDFSKLISKKYNFISIHYGVVEKLHEKRNKGSIFETLADLFKDTNAFVSVHSGRGDLHKFKDQNDESNQVAFIPLSGIEWALDNSKFMLTELFYNQKYIPL